MKQKKVLLGDRQRMESNTVVSHYTGEKEIDRVIRALAEKQTTAAMNSHGENKKIPA